MYDAQEEDRHLSAGHDYLGAKVQRGGRTAACQAFGIQFIDPGVGPMSGRHIRKNIGGGRRRVGRSVHGAQQENCHLGAGHVGFGAIAQGIDSTAARDAFSIQFVDPRHGPMSLGYILKNIWDRGGWACAVGRLPKGGRADGKEQQKRHPCEKYFFHHANLLGNTILALSC